MATPLWPYTSLGAVFTLLNFIHAGLGLDPSPDSPRRPTPFFHPRAVTRGALERLISGQILLPCVRSDLDIIAELDTPVHRTRTRRMLMSKRVS
jgi:hypothetical protein